MLWTLLLLYGDDNCVLDCEHCPNTGIGKLHFTLNS
jgi:hypothetical protein